MAESEGSETSRRRRKGSSSEDDEVDAKSIASLSVVDGGVEVDLGDTYLEIHSQGPLDINVRRQSGSRSGLSTPRSRSSKSPVRRVRALSKEETDWSSGARYDSFLQSRGFDPSAIDQAAGRAADLFLSDEEDVDDDRLDLQFMAKSDAKHVQSPTSRALEDRLARLEKLLEQDPDAIDVVENRKSSSTEEEKSRPFDWNKQRESQRNSIHPSETDEQIRKDPPPSPSISESSLSQASLEKRMDRLDRLLAGIDEEDANRGERETADAKDTLEESYDEEEIIPPQNRTKTGKDSMEHTSFSSPRFATDSYKQSFKSTGLDNSETLRSRSPNFPRSESRNMDLLTQATEWQKLNSTLEKAGFHGIELGENGLPDLDTGGNPGAGLFTEIREILSQHERRGQLIEELTADTTKTRSEDSRILQKLRATEQELRQTKHELAISNERTQLVESNHASAQKGDLTTLRKLQQDNSAIKQKLALSEHRVKAKEAVIEKLQKKLESQLKRQQSQSEKTKDLFKDLEKRTPRPSSVTDQKVLEVIQAYETKRKEEDDENEILKAEVRRLNESLREKDNFLTGSKQSELETFEESLERRAQTMMYDHRASEAALEKREKALVLKMSKLESQLRQVNAEKEHLEDAVENLKLELASRPTMRDWKAAQHRISNLEVQVQTAVEALETQEVEHARTQNIFIPKKKVLPQRDQLTTREKVELLARQAVTERADREKRTSTAELIRKDKLNHRLGLGKISSLPKTTAHEVIQEICRVLEVSEVELIVPALQKMCWIIRAMPRLEQFVKQVTSFVSLHGDEVAKTSTERDELANEGNRSSFRVISSSTMESVLPQLKRWMADIRQLKAVRSFRDMIRSELAKSAGVKSRLGDPFVRELDVRDLTEEQLIRAVQDLVDLENNVLQSKEAFQAADAFVKQNPEVLVNRCIAHFQQLFEVRSTEGVFPKLNELYVFSSEMNNFLQVLRPTLHLSNRASVHTCLARVQELVLKATDTYKEEKTRPNLSAKPKLRGNGERSANSGDSERDFYLPQWE